MNCKITNLENLQNGEKLQDGGVELIHGECLTVMKTFPSNYFSTLICDPPYGLSFMGKKWDYDAPSVEIWKEALRVLKPGGTALIFAGSRTQHRMAVNVEDAGFILKDIIMWLYGSGFPKSHNISKQLDKMAGAERKVVGHVTSGKMMRMSGQNERPYQQGKTRINHPVTAPTSPEAQQWNGWHSHALKPAYEPIIMAMKPNTSTYAKNALEHGVAGLWIDGARITEKGRFPANVILDEEAGRLLDEQTGNLGKSSGGNSGVLNNNVYGEFNTTKNNDGTGFGDSGGASRFFKQCSSDIDNICFLCYNTITKAKEKETCQNKNKSVQSAKKNSTNTHQTTEHTAQTNVVENLNEKAVLFVRSVENLCDSCTISIVQKSVAIQTGNMESRVIQDFITDYKKCTLIQSLAQYAEKWESIDTTPTTKSLSKLFGSANLAITKCINETTKSAPKRFSYHPKASKKEKNAGLESFSPKLQAGAEFRPNHMEKALNGEDGNPYGRWSPTKNHHPTVKPIALMEYLCNLTKTPFGGIVLDPFMGSGSTGIACVKTGRPFKGIEMDQEYIQIADARISHAQNELKKQPGLF